MKIFYRIIIVFSFLITVSAVAQAPNKMSYQAVLRNTVNALITNQNVGMKISILQGSISGTAVYVETQIVATNINGLVSLEIGAGVPVLGIFGGINWATGPYYIKTETDPAGGTAYSIIGASQLLSVAYAMYSNSAGSSVSTHNVGEIYGGGIVFWATTDGLHGLIAETLDTNGAGWFTANDAITTNSTHSAAGKLFTDWYLPSKNELNLLYNYNSFNSNILNMSPKIYLTTTEINTTDIWIQNFATGVTTQTSKFSGFDKIRAIRRF